MTRSPVGLHLRKSGASPSFWGLAWGWGVFFSSVLFWIAQPVWKGRKKNRYADWTEGKFCEDGRMIYVDILRKKKSYRK